MKTSYIYLSLLLLFQSLNGLCTPGCLKCDPFNQCLFCDYTKGFVLLNDSSCQKKTIANCYRQSLEGNCLQCNRGYYLPSPTDNTCVQVTTQIDHCDFYSSGNTCLTCQSKFVVEGNLCVAITTDIANCLNYSQKDLCSECNTGFFLGIGQKECVKYTDIGNCKVHSQIKCRGCSSNYFLQNDVFKASFSFFDKTTNFQQLLTLYNRNSNSLIEDNCRAIQVQNCSEFSSFHQCKKCQPGYYVNSMGNCNVNPKEVIPNCEIYLSLTVCNKCQAKYYKKSSSQCVAVIPVERCAIYDGGQQYTLCTFCEEGYYLKDQNNCFQRMNVVELCHDYSADKDQCSKCNPNYTLTTDGLKCLPTISNCKEYFENTFNDTQLECRFCDDGYYWMDLKCNEGPSSDNCQIYIRNSTLCSMCNNGFYLDPNNKCVPHELLPGCSQYSPLVANKCEECNSFSHLMSVKNECTTFSLPSCEDYYNPTHCKKCAQGFNLTYDEKCETMPTNLTNCLRAQYSLCIECSSGFYILKGECAGVNEYQTSKCDKNNLLGFESTPQQICNYCQTDSKPLSMKNDFVCLSTAKYQALPGASLITNCTLYKPGPNGIYQCVNCSNGSVDPTGKCDQSLTCNTNTKQIYKQAFQVKDTFIEYIYRNQCVDKKDDVCIEFGLSSQQNQNQENTHACLKCKSAGVDQMKIVDLMEDKHVLVTDSGIDFTNADQYYWGIQFQCHNQTDGNVKKIRGTFDQSCQYYFKIFNDEYGCLRCKAGFTGTIQNWDIPKCKKYDVDWSCLACAPGYFVYDTNKYECVQIDTTTPNLEPTFLQQCNSISFDQKQCHLCNPTYYLDLSQNPAVCVERENEIDYCSIYHVNLDKCFLCNDNFQLSPNELECWDLSTAVPDCEVMSDATTCSKCKTGYYLDENICNEITDPECFENTVDNATCLIYKKIPFIKKFTCTIATTIDHCMTYTDTGACSKCDDGYYLYLDSASATKCIENTFNPSTNSADPGKCNIFYYDNDDDEIYCKECIDGYFLYKADDDFICVQDSYVIEKDASGNWVQSQTISTTQNESLCSVYDFSRNACVLCADTYNLYGTMCCLNGTYGPDCADISSLGNGFADCQWIYFDQEDTRIIKCGECKSDGTNLKLTNFRCCTATQYFDYSTNSCVEIPTGCSSFDEQKKICLTCNAGSYLNDGLCCELENYNNTNTCTAMTGLTIAGNDFTSCDQFDLLNEKCLNCTTDSWYFKKCQVTTNMDVCQKMDNQTKKCLECESTHFLASGQCCLKSSEFYNATTGLCETVGTPITDCIIHSSATECSECTANYLKLDSNKKCCSPTTPILDGSNNCVAFTWLFTANCINQNPANDQSCSLCEKNYYQFNNGCCEEGQFYNTTNKVCQDITTITNCKQVDGTDTATCVKCHDLFDNQGTSCENNSGKEFHRMGQNECFYGLFSDETNTCVEFKDMIPAAKINYETTIVDSDPLTVSCRTNTLQVDSFGDKGKQCLFPYSENQIKYTGTTQSDSCLFTQEDGTCLWCPYSDQSPNETYALGFLGQQIGSYIQDDVILSDNQKYHLQFGKCCQVGFYNQNDNCLPSPIPNCKIFNPSTRLCSTCMDGYHSQLDFKACCLTGESYDPLLKRCHVKLCASPNYYSNGQCCPEGKYWDMTSNRCMKILIPNCIKSKNGIECDECALTHYLSPTSSLVFNSNFWWPVWNENQKILSFNECVLKTTFNSNWMMDRSKILQCNSDSTHCSCGADKYNVLDTACCDYKSMNFKKYDQILCVTPSLILANCVDFSQFKNECIKCKTNFHLSKKFCCALNQYFDLVTQECTDVTNCDLTNPETGDCLKCSNGFYMAEDKCIDQLKYKKGKEIVDHVDTNCLNANFDGRCTKCKPKDDSDNELYLNRGRCCKVGFFFDNLANGCVQLGLDDTILGAGFANCKRLNNFNECGECAVGHNISNGRCCPDGQVWNFYSCMATLDTNCKVFKNHSFSQLKNLKEFKCKTCANDNYADDSGNMCCKYGEQSWYNPVSENYECIPGNTIGCKTYDSLSQCLSCDNGYYLVQENKNSMINSQCILDAQKTSATYGDCLEWNESDNCIKCKGNEFDTSDDPIVCHATNRIYGCSISYYNGSIQLCQECMKGFLLKPQGECIQQTDKNCVSINNSGTCLMCKDGYNLMDNGITPICKLNIDYDYTYQVKQYKVNSGTGAVDESIIKCYDQVLNSTCTDTGYIPNCTWQSATDNIIYCLECQPHYLPHNNRQICCHQSEYYDINTNKCQKVPKDQIKGCKEQKGSKCFTCDIGFELTNNYCCPTGSVFNGSNCVKQTDIKFIDKCSVYDGDANCVTCQTGNYLTNSKCCPRFKFYNNQTRKCDDIPIKNCLEYSANICQQCNTDFYYDNGECIPLGFYKDSKLGQLISSSSSISKFPKCQKVEGGKCKQCIDTFALGNGTTTSVECCSGTDHVQFYIKEENKCVVMPNTKCTTFDFTNGLCTVCEAGSYNTGRICCTLGDYYDEKSNTCKVINTLSKVEFPFKDQCKGITKNDYRDKKCSTCDTGFLRNNICCDNESELNFKGTCVSTDLISNCNIFNDKGGCTECDNGYVLTGNSYYRVCCETGKYFNGTICDTNPTTIENCEIYDTDGCNKCLPDFNLQNNLCCPNGSFAYNGKCATNILVQNCKTYDKNNICTSCIDNYFIQNTSNNNYCCSFGAIYDSTLGICVDLDTINAHCLELDTKEGFKVKPKCKLCDQNYYVSNGVCSEDGKYWDDKTGTMKTIVAATDKCLQYSEDKCLKCTDDTLQYIHAGRCCELGKFWNGTECVSGNQTNCDKYQECKTSTCLLSSMGDYCSTCKDGNYLYANQTCCAASQFLSGTCKVYDAANAATNFHPALSDCEYFTEDFKCLKCSTDNAIRTIPVTHCCVDKLITLNASNQLECVDTSPLPSQCKEYQGDDMLCQKCLPGYYNIPTYPEIPLLANCCASLSYYDYNNKTCKLISTIKLVDDTEKFPNCNQYDMFKRECIQCKAEFVLYAGQCQAEISNCSLYDENFTTCLSCDDNSNYYLTNGRCCQLGKYFEIDTCISIETSLLLKGCQKVSGNKCLSCETGKYLTHNQCCLLNQYFDIASNDQSMPKCKDKDANSKCEIFGSNKEECLKCIDNHLLIRLANEVTECLPIDSAYNCPYPSYTQGALLNELNCNKCTDNYLKSEATENIYTVFADDIPNCMNPTIHNHLSKTSRTCYQYNSTTCQANEHLVNQQCISIPIPDCIEYDFILELCQKCVDGKHLNHYNDNGIKLSSCIDIAVDDLNAPSETYGYISNCTESALSTKNALQNIPKMLDKFYSVHLCDDSDEIPFAFIRTQGQLQYPLGISQWNKNATLSQNVSYRQLLNDANDNFATGESNQCMLPTLAGQFTNLPDSGSLIPGCALAMINTQVPLSFQYNNDEKSDLSSLSVFCTSCKHGYYPMYNPRVPIHVYQCKPVLNCDISASINFVNGCNKCQGGFIWGYNKDTGVDYTVCKAEGSNTNCLAADSNGVCQFCKEGYSLNINKQCLQLPIFSCTTPQSLYKPFKFIDFQLIFLNHQKPYGCNQCADTFVGVYNQENTYECVTDSSPVNNYPNCLKFGLNNSDLVCKVCNDGFILTIENTCTEMTTVLANCDIAFYYNLVYSCYQCSQGFIPVNNLCIPPVPITNCSEYVMNPMPETTCKVCNDQFFLVNNTCVQGEIQNCRKYITKEICQQCMDGYVLMNLLGSQICLKVQDTFNCLQWSQNEAQEKDLICTQCPANQYIQNFTTAKQSCQPFINVSGCILYDKNTRIDESSMMCLECSKDYYLKDKQCVSRTQIPNCYSYSKFNDKCVKCIDSHYLDDSQTNCYPIPDGIPGCLEYQDLQTCLKCKEDLYPYQNQCYSIYPEEMIQNCRFYNTKKECQQCKPGFVLENQLCIGATKDCLTFYNHNNCSSCNPGQALVVADILSTDPGTTSCMAFTPLNNCILHEQISPVKCLICSPDYYVMGDGTCSSVALVIPNCKQYSDSNNCSVCNQGYVLMTTKKECKQVDGLQNQCMDLAWTDTFCTDCKEGFSLQDDGTCVQNTAAVKNCILENSSGSCDFCMSGYYMDKNLQCISE